ncbi:hypothetical protein ACWDUL_21050 [Nocardia niigatensis]
MTQPLHPSHGTVTLTLEGHRPDGRTESWTISGSNVEVLQRWLGPGDISSPETTSTPLTP